MVPRRPSRLSPTMILALALVGALPGAAASQAPAPACAENVLNGCAIEKHWVDTQGRPGQSHGRVRAPTGAPRVTRR